MKNKRNNVESDYSKFAEDEDLSYYDDLDDIDMEKYQKKKVTMRDVKDGYKTLKGQGKTFIYYLAMVIVLIIVNILAGRGIVPKFVQYILLVGVVAFTYFKYLKFHENDEDDLN